jgi:hypothetical protein
MAQTAEEITDPLLRFYRIVLPAGPGVCQVGPNVAAATMG